MANNAGTSDTSGFTRSAQYAAYEALPPAVREALRVSNLDYAAAQILQFYKAKGEAATLRAILNINERDSLQPDKGFMGRHDILAKLEGLK